MKGLLTITAALSLVVSEASAHYIFQQFSVGSRKYGVYEHIRKNTNYNSPVTSLSSNDLRCNEGGLTGGNTTIVDIKAGDSFSFTSDQEVYHQGPVSLYLSKAPGSVSNYQGDGGWVKFFDWGPTFGSGQPAWPLRSTYTQTIPRCIPNGEYLLRIQSLAIHNPGGVPQFYISCAQIRVSGGGSANLDSGNVRIPGVFKATDPGYTANIWNGLKSYTVPGGPVWTCP